MRIESKYRIGQRVHANGTPGTGKITHVEVVLGKYTYTIVYDDGALRHAIEERIVLVVPEQKEG